MASKFGSKWRSRTSTGKKAHFLRSAAKKIEQTFSQAATVVTASKHEDAIDPVLLAEMRRERRRRLAKDLATKFTFIGGFLGIGVLFYRVVERKECTSGSDNCQCVHENGTAVYHVVDGQLQEWSCTEPWSVIDSLYFATVTMSTVGYGDFSPTKGGSRVFTCFYIAVALLAVRAIFRPLSPRGALMLPPLRPFYPCACTPRRCPTSPPGPQPRAGR